MPEFIRIPWPNRRLRDLLVVLAPALVAVAVRRLARLGEHPREVGVARLCRRDVAPRVRRREDGGDGAGAPLLLAPLARRARA